MVQSPKKLPFNLKTPKSKSYMVPDGFEWFIIDERDMNISYITSKEMVMYVRDKIDFIKENVEIFSSQAQNLLNRTRFDIVTPDEAKVILQDLFDKNKKLYKIEKNTLEIKVSTSKKYGVRIKFI